MGATVGGSMSCLEKSVYMCVFVCVCVRVGETERESVAVKTVIKRSLQAFYLSLPLAVSLTVGV